MNVQKPESGCNVFWGPLPCFISLADINNVKCFKRKKKWLTWFNSCIKIHDIKVISLWELHVVVVTACKPILPLTRRSINQLAHSPMVPAALRCTLHAVKGKRVSTPVSNWLADALHFPRLQPAFLTFTATLLTRHYTSSELTLTVLQFIMVLH